MAQAAMREAAAAGLFYPAEPDRLRAAVRGLLSAAAVGADEAPPKALIAPHAGYAYSGPVAAAAYGILGPLKGTVGRVVLIGPAHFVPVKGVAAPSVAAFATPLGPVAVDVAAIAGLAARGLATFDDRPHRDEHALEVHLPFLRAALGDVAVVPLLVGEAAAENVAEALEALWGGPETLIVVSSDLSHYLASADARRRDGATAEAIEALDGAALGGDDACGYRPIAGLLLAARRRGLSVRRLDLRNSGDTAGPEDRVVGYGAWAFTEPNAARRPA